MLVQDVRVVVDPNMKLPKLGVAAGTAGASVRYEHTDASMIDA